MKNYDVVIIGAGTAGAFLANRLCARGHSVLVIEKNPREKIGTKYDIFHIEEKEFARFDLPRPKKGDAAWAFEFTKNYTADPKNLYPRLAENPIVGLHMHEYTALLNERAKASGAHFLYNAAFSDFLYEDGKITGVIYETDGEQYEQHAKVTVDCAGMFTPVRTSLPDDCLVENFKLGGEDMFYVILRYVKLLHEKDYLDGSCGWPFFKSWIAPCADPAGAIVGIGAVHGYDYAESVYRKMLEHITLPEHTLVKTEKGCTPYTRPPYSFVTDNFVVSGDAGCLTKPINGEGVTSGMAHLEIVAKVLDRRLRTGNTSAEALWEINKKYNLTQGADFAFTRALLVGVINAASFDEFEFAFESGLISDELIAAGSAGPELKLSPAFLAGAAKTLLGGIFSGKVSKQTVKETVRALKTANAVKTHYLNFPDKIEGFKDWCAVADEMWDRIGKIK